MKNAFNLQNFLSENRNTVIEKYNEAAKNQFFTGISLKDFMLKVYNDMLNNNPRSEKKANSLFPTILGEVTFNVSRPYTF